MFTSQLRVGITTPLFPVNSYTHVLHHYTLPLNKQNEWTSSLHQPLHESKSTEPKPLTCEAPFLNTCTRKCH